MESTLHKIRSSALQLLENCRRDDWAGPDPYDALNSRLFAASPFNRSRFCRLALTQFFKRSPINFRRLLAVPKGQNPKGIALFLSSLLHLETLGLASPDETHRLAQTLDSLATPGQPHACWGYHFDWQAWDGYVPKWEPNIICTTFAANALLDLYEARSETRHLNRAASAVDFILSTLLRHTPDGSPWITYTPRSVEAVHNASLLGAALLARLHSFTPDDRLRQLARQVADFSLKLQFPDGSWMYGEGSHQRWIDSFHTGYNLLALDVIRRCTGAEYIQPHIQRGCRYFQSHFLHPNGVVAYYHDRVYPIDCHCTAQAILTLVDLPQHFDAPRENAEKIATWAIDNMRGRGGFFFYQRHRLYTNRIAYTRWTQAWMLKALIHLLQPPTR